MALGDWSGRRIVATWVIGLGLQAALLFSLVGLGRRFAERNAPRLHAQQAALDERWKVGEAADAASRSVQRAGAIAAGKYSVSPQGDTSIAVVVVPSLRPSEVSVSIDGAVTIPLISLVLFAGIPVILIAITTGWILSRRRQRALELMDDDQF